MPSLVKKTKKGHDYYYAVQCARVNGKPRIVWQKYLGTLDALLKRADDATPPAPTEAVIFEAGGVAALWRIAQRLHLVEIIDEAVPKRDQGPSVGHYLVLAALNRALAPCSKLRIGEWYEQTVLRRLWGFPPSAFASPRFWDHMDPVSEQAIDHVQDALATRLVQAYPVEREVLLYDTTNFFTFIATPNERADIAQRGHSKAKRHDLRQVGLALLVTGQGHLPLFHRVYAGNLADAALFPALAEEMLERHAALVGQGAQATFVFDKGNVSDAALQRFVLPGRYFVAAVSASQAKDLLAEPLAAFQAVPGLPGTQALVRPQPFGDMECTAVVAYTESFFTQQLAGVTTNLVRCQKSLQDLAKSLEQFRAGKGRGKRPTVREVQQSVRALLARQFMKDLFETYVEEHEGLPRLRYALDHAALAQLTAHRLGRTVLVTNHSGWEAGDTIRAYRALTGIEDAFKAMKHLDYLHWQPAYHWTTQKIRVHGFYCVLGLLLATLAHQTVLRAGMDLSLPRLLDELTGIREVAVFYPPGTPGQRQDHITLSRMTPRQRKIAECLEVAEALVG